MGGKMRGLEETRRLSRAIDRWVDLIPAKFFLDTVREDHSADITKIKTTSQLVVEAVKAEEKRSKSVRKRQKKIAQKLLESAENGDGAENGDLLASSSRAGTRAELQQKLADRISSMQQARRQKQSEMDKAKARARWEELQRTNPGGRPAGKGEPSSSQSRPRRTESGGCSVEGDADIEDTVEPGRLSFKPSVADVPLQEGRRGAKAQRLRASLRQEEHYARRLAEADSDTERAEIHREVGMKKALARLDGRKVHDDASRLRKSSKVLDMRKKRSKSKWEARMEQEKQKSAEKQEQRNQNLKGRRSKKKGKREGFEGAKTGYID